ncbi:hypothetical protein [Thermococcus aciditolerans]|uniref:C2H2-type domain-containing protein n=1 Tax=Thermococcus aciditolerans TaxID=2598455 RepID=A0A5C0SQI7_9EURY|nr:hypothetical protein [Thermococcus aciditolerans]QEK15458.1 hypothetical protein FPV09_10575 [Thermococcus aciditolerans]
MFLHVESGLASEDYDVLLKAVKKEMSLTTEKLKELGFDEDIAIGALVFEVPSSSKFYCKACLDAFDDFESAQRHVIQVHSKEDALKFRGKSVDELVEMLVGEIKRVEPV